MPYVASKIVASASLIALASAHGFIKSPAPRMPGDAFQAACGEQPYYNQEGDNYGNVQGLLQVAGDDLDASKCNVWLCKGYQFDDNKDNVQEWTAGQDVEMEIDIRAPHTGVANVSVVSTSSNSIIGSVLKSFENYASTETGVTADETSFTVTLPELGGECATAGDCVLQWWWDAPEITQTYESCIDFVVGGSGSAAGSGSGSAPSSGASSSAASNGTAPASTSVAANNNVKASSSSAPASAATGSSGDDEECKVEYVTVTAGAQETGAARKHKRHAAHHN